MGRSQETNKKKEVRKNKEKKKKDKEKKKQARKNEKKENTLDDMIAYVNEDGTISSTPPDENDKEDINAEDIDISTPKKDTTDQEEEIRKGTVVFFDDNKGFGFIRDLSNGHSIFVHANGLMDDIKEGNLVTFDVEQGKKGLNAVNVKLFKQ
ncbi:MAG: cold-shock protein [Bacteroidales bacterium]